MNISLGGAVSPSTKRGQSPRMAEGSAAANRGVAPSRVGKQVRRPWGETGRQPCPSTASLPYLLCGDRSAETVRSTKQVMPSVALNSTAMVRNQDWRWINDRNNSDAASGQRLWVHQG